MKRQLQNVNFENRIKEKNYDSIIVSGKKLFNFSSNDYLSLSKNKKLISESKKWIDLFGVGLSSSRLISGNLEKISEIECLLSKFLGREKSLIFSGGFLMNSTLIPALTNNNIGQRNDVKIFSDKLNHASINYGCYLTRQKIARYNHLDLNHLEFLLKKSEKKNPKFIITETIFSMDGDTIDIENLRFIAKKFNAFLYLDEAHSLGIYGKKGAGISSSGKYEKEIIVGTFGKSFGCFGSFVSASRKVIEKIVNSCSGLIYTTALPPAVYASIFAALKLMPSLNSERKKILENSKFLRTNLSDLSIDLGYSDSHIIPLILKSEKMCLKLKKYLETNGYFVKAITSPTVMKGKERIRLSVTATMKRKKLGQFLEILKNLI